MATKNKSYVGKGKLYLNGRFVGNVPTLDLSAEVETIELEDSTTPGGGLYNSIERVSAAGFAFEFSDYSAENLAMATFGSYANVAGGAQAAESISAPSVLDHDTLVRTAFTIDTADVAGTVVVDTDPAGTPYALNTDYLVSAAGITILASGSIPVDAPLLVDYVALAVDLVQALVTSGQEYNMVFDGLNEAQSGSPVVVTIYKGKPGAATGIPLISSDFAANPVEGSIVKDTSVVGQGLSQYYTVAVA